MTKLIIIVFFCFFSVLAKAAVQAQVDLSHVGIDDSFRLTITQENIQNRGVPDLTPLQKEFMILGTERRMNYSIINGQTQSSNEWTITLKAQKVGKLTIPAIKIGNEQTTPITIDVTAGSTPQNTTISPSQQQQQQQNQGIFLTATVNKKNPYVNQQIIYKVALYNSKHLLDANYQGPQVDNALLIPLGEEKRYQTQKGDTTYLVEEQSYAIFPQKSGTLKIKSPVFTALIYDFNPERVKAQDKTISLKVQSIPKSYSGKDWLPAKEVKLSEQYEHSDPSISQGNTLIRTVTLEGVGVPAQLLPNLKFAEIEGFHVYPEKGKDKNKMVQGELISHIEIKVTYLFNKPGKITIPELKLPWFNTKTGREEIATLPAKTIDVIPSSSTTIITNTNQAVSNNDKHVTKLIQETSESNSQTQFNWAWIIAAFFAIAWLFTLILWGWQKHHRNNRKGYYKTVLDELHKACSQGNPQRTRDTLLKWASLHWPDASILNLTDLSHLTPNASFKKQIQMLSQILYKNQEKVLWRGDELWRSIQQIINHNDKNKEKENVLPPLNPS